MKEEKLNILKKIRYDSHTQIKKIIIINKKKKSLNYNGGRNDITFQVIHRVKNMLHG